MQYVLGHAPHTRISHFYVPFFTDKVWLKNHLVKKPQVIIPFKFFPFLPTLPTSTLLKLKIEQKINILGDVTILLWEWTRLDLSCLTSLFEIKVLCESFII